MAQIKLRGTPINTNSDLPKVGSKAPDFHLTAADLSDVTLATYKGKKKLLNIVPTSIRRPARSRPRSSTSMPPSTATR